VNKLSIWIRLKRKHKRGRIGKIWNKYYIAVYLIISYITIEKLNKRKSRA
jgi:hypothetical protein